MNESTRVQVVSDADEVAVAASRMVLEAARNATARSGMFRIALAGGSTPRRLYALLAQSHDTDFSRWQVFFGDERWVAPDHPDSNYRMAREALLDHVPIPAQQVHPIDTTAGSPERAARLYALTLQRKLAPFHNGLPRFDVVLLGLGADGHTASLFPGSSALEAAPGELVVATWVASQRTWRVTLTAAAINAAACVTFLVAGADKSVALARVLDDAGQTQEGPPPAARIRPTDGELVFVADRAARPG